jgi:septum site-determining protein MinC
MAELDNFEYHDIKNGKFYCQEIIVKKVDAQKLALYLSSSKKKHPEMFSNLNISLNFKAIKFESDEQSRVVLQNYFNEIIELGHNVVGTLGIKHAVSKAFNIQPLIEHKDKPSLVGGWQVSEPKTETVQNQTPIESTTNTISATKIIRGIVRGGTVVRADNENVLVIGSVRHGAEIIAGGSVTIYGALEGRVMAGLVEKNSFVLAQDFKPDLVAINGVYMTCDQIVKKELSGAVLVTLDNSGENLDISGECQ